MVFSFVSLSLTVFLGAVLTASLFIPLISGFWGRYFAFVFATAFLPFYVFFSEVQCLNSCC